MTSIPAASSPESAARARRRAAAERFRPNQIDLLLVAEAPPSALDRYFYFLDVRDKDSLFRYVVRGILNREPTRSGKADFLAELRNRGVFLIDLSEDPLGAAPLSSFVPSLIERCRTLNPKRIILIKTTVFDAAHHALKGAGLPVVPQRIPFPGSGQQKNFETAFATALSCKV
jgi:hypothetical protein